MKFDLYLVGFLVVFLGCNIFLTYKVLQSKSLERKEKIYKLLLMWCIPYFGFFLVFYSINNQTNNKKNKSESASPEFHSDNINMDI